MKNNVTDKMFRRLQLKFTLIVSGICIALMTVCFAGAISANAINMEIGISAIIDSALASPLSSAFPDGETESGELPQCSVVIVSGGEYITVSKYDYLTDGELRGAVSAAADGLTEITIDGQCFRLGTRTGDIAGRRCVVYAVYDYTAIKNTFIVQLAALVFALCGLILFVSLLTHMISGRVLSPARDSLVKQKDLIANAGHELKTPVTIIGANLDVIRADADLTVADNSKWLDNIEAQTKRMSSLITELLEMSSFESADYKSEITTFELGALIEGACLSFEAACFERGIALEMACEEATVSGDEKAWGKIIGILLDNAVKYSDDGGKISVALSVIGSKKKKQAEFSVTNGGRTIPPEEIGRIFDRFHKVGDSSNSFGLGLAMAKAISDNLGGKITCASVSGVTTFTVTAPVNLQS